MQWRWRALRSSSVALLAPVLVVATGCGSSSRRATSPAPTASAPTTTTAAAGKSLGNVTVFAAASLTEALGQERSALASRESVTYSFAGSGVLVQQIQQGAPADVVATADMASMDELVKAGLVDAPQVFAHNKLEILVAPGNPDHIETLADLARKGLVLVLCNATVPAGKYAEKILEQAGVTVHPKSLEPDVKSAVREVTSGEADATIVYVTDVVAAGSAGEGVMIPDAQNAVATYPIAVVNASKHRAAAQAFVAALVGPAGQAVLAKFHFLPAA